MCALLVTHKHWDHQAGVRKVLRRERPVTAGARPWLAHDPRPTDPETLFALPGSIAVVAGENEPVEKVTHRASVRPARVFFFFGRVARRPD